jgi:hypothetical protein
MPSAADLASAETVFNSMLSYITSQVNNVYDNDLAVSNIQTKYWKKYNYTKGFIFDRVNQEMQVEAVDNGAELTRMSSF